MIIVTGGAGFIGSNIIKGLNAIGRTDIVVVDDLTDGTKFRNLAANKFYDYVDYEDFLNKIITDKSVAKSVDAIFHEGACSVTTEWNGRYLMRNNYEYTKQLLHYCAKHHIPLIYASSAAVYGGNQIFKETSLTETPLNVYGYSKWQFDLYLLQHLAKLQSPVIGLRYFNVYGPQEQHKGPMASVAFHFANQLRATGMVKLFEGCDGYANGEQLRDFIYVDDIVKVNLWLLDRVRAGRAIKSGVYNVGTGQARSFNDVAKILIAANGHGKIEYIPFPDKLKGAYQSFTQADISKLREAGYTAAFCSLEQGLKNYFAWMNPGVKKISVCV